MILWFYEKWGSKICSLQSEITSLKTGVALEELHFFSYCLFALQHTKHTKYIAVYCWIELVLSTAFQHLHVGKLLDAEVDGD